jgi:predicted membrane protein|tara:strand:+ start:146 stop:535 length:390 start_codon:yes stop_codon:yes gene_type:complete
LKYENIKIGSNRSFGIVFFVVFLSIGLWPILTDNQLRIWSIVISLIFLILGVFNSKILTPLNKVWFRFGIFLGNFVAPIIMGIVFFLVVTPTGLIMKLFRKDLINLRKNNSDTYWIEKKDIKSSMKNQF